MWQEPFGPGRGGVHTMAEALLPALRGRGHDLAVVSRQDATDGPQRGMWKGIPVYRFPLWQALESADPAAIMRWRREIERLERDFAPELVHLNSFGPTALYHLEARRAAPPPLLVTLHSSNVLVPGSATVLRRTLRAASWTTACSHALLAQARRVAPEIEARSSVIHNGVDPPVGAPSPLPFDEPRVLCLGQLAPHKGFDLAIRACAVVRARFPRLRLIVAGEGPARRDLEALVEREGLGAAVDFVGRVAHADVPELLDTVTLVALPSRREAFPLVALEAAVMGRPVVAARVDGLPEAVADRETGLLVDPESPVALAAAITFLLTHPDAAVAMGAAGRRRAAREFGLARHVDAYDRLYRTLREGPVPG